MNYSTNTVSDLYKNYYHESEHLMRKSKYTLLQYNNIFRLLFRTYPTLAELSAMTPEFIENFLMKSMLERKWCDKTYVGYRMCMSGFFSWCIRKGYLYENPIKKVFRPRLKRKKPKPLNQMETEMLLTAALNNSSKYRFPNYRNHALFSLMIFAGLRVGECLKLKLNHVDFVSDIIRVEDGKGGHDRCIPLLPRLKAILMEYLKERERLNKTHLYFISSTNRDMGFTYSSVNKVIDQIVAKTGVKWRSHRLRCTFATMLLNDGANIKAVQTLLGHVDCRTTDLYAAVCDPFTKQQMFKHPLNQGFQSS